MRLRALGLSRSSQPLSLLVSSKVVGLASEGREKKKTYGWRCGRKVV
jgi:hypothetical protein